MRKNLYGVVGKLKSGKSTVTAIWQLLDTFYNDSAIIKHRKMYAKGDSLVKGCDWYANDINYTLKFLQSNKHAGISTKWHEVSFAYKLKQIISLITSIPMIALFDQEVKASASGIGNYSVRDLHKKIGTDLFRNQLGNDVWVNALFNDFGEKKWIVSDVRFLNEAKAITEREGILIKIVRFNIGDRVYFAPGEGSNDRDKKGEYLISKINADEDCLISDGYSEIGAWFSELKLISADNHQSETELEQIETDYTIYNCTTIENLIEQVKEIMIEEGIINEKS